MKNLKNPNKIENTTTRTETTEIKEIKGETINTINNSKDSALEAGLASSLRPCLNSQRSPQV
jgi:hypothetical protein